MNKLIVVATLAAMLAGCASSGGLGRAERLELYRSHAGEPVDSFRFIGSAPHGWTPLDDSTLVVWTRPKEAWLLELFGPCNDIESVPAISIDNTMGRVSAKFDNVRTLGGIPGVRIPCRIDSIRPLDVRSIKQAEKDLREARSSESQASGT